MFGRATIRLGIGPHSSLSFVCIVLCLLSFPVDEIDFIITYAVYTLTLSLFTETHMVNRYGNYYNLII